MNIEDLKHYWKSEEAAAHIHGWDFSYIEGRYVSEENDMPWDYKEVIRKYLKETDRLLDIDTGGGEFLLSLGHPYELTSATEGYAPNVALCREKLDKLGIDFREMSDYTKMPFENGTFDVVINRHGTYDVNEIYRVLKPGGLFITQQVGEENDRELVFKLCPGVKKLFDGHNMESQVELFEKAGFTTVEKGEVFKPIRFFDTGALVWFARIIEWEFLNFSVDACFEQLLEVEKEIREKGAVEGSVHRFYFVMRR